MSEPLSAEDLSIYPSRIYMKFPMPALGGEASVEYVRVDLYRQAELAARTNQETIKAMRAAENKERNDLLVSAQRVRS